MVMKKFVSAGTFKATCLRLMDEVYERRTEIVITKRGTPVARLVAAEATPKTVLGCMVGTGEIRGDLVEPVVGANEWRAAEPE